jgi:hypothetical protein
MSWTSLLETRIGGRVVMSCSWGIMSVVGVVASTVSVLGTIVVIITAMTLSAARGILFSPTSHLYFPGFEHGTGGIVGPKGGIEKRKGIFEGCRAPTKAMFRGPTVATSTLMLDAGLAACLVGK